MSFKGRITVWDDDRGFGFITPSTGGKQVFVHVKAFGYDSRRPELNRLVSYDMSKDAQGRPCAVEVHMAADRAPRKAPRRSRKTGRVTAIGAIFFLVVLGQQAIVDDSLRVVGAIYWIASLITFGFYRADKSAAKQGAQRVPESFLHWCSLVGGWPGALVAQSLLRHKTLKQPFRLAFWLTVLINVALLALWYVQLFEPGLVN